MAFLATTIAYSQKTIDKTYSGVKSIRLETSSGSGLIKKSSSNEVKVTVEYTYDDDEYKPTFEQRGDRLIIDEDFRRRGRSSWSSRGRARWTLEVPNGLSLDYASGSGSIEIDGVDIDLNVGTGSGGIEVMDVTGELRVSTGSGSIRIENSEGDIDASTGSGSIRVRSSKGQTELSTGSGGIRLEDAEGEFELSTGSGSIDAMNIKITGVSEFSTGSGSVDVELGAELNHDLTVGTGSGRATLDFNGNKIEGEFILEADKRRGDIRAPFKFDKEYEEEGRGWRDRNVRMIKEAKIGSKDIRIKIGTGSGDVTIKK